MSNLSKVISLTNEEQKLLQNATELVPFLKEYGTEIDKNMHIPEEVIEKLSSAGLFKLRTPKKYGGFEVSIRAMIEIVSEVAKGNGSVGWVIQNLNGNNYSASQLLPSNVVSKIFNQVNEVRFCSVLQAIKTVVRKVEGGYLVEYGRWAFGSGSKHATHALLNLKDASGMQQDPKMQLAVVPMDEIKIIDDWHTMSLKGSASNSLEMNDVFISDEFVAYEDAEQVDESMLQHLKGEDRFKPYLFLITSLTTGISTILGLARGALEHFVEKAPHKGIAMTIHKSQAEIGHIQYKVGLAAMKIESAHLHIHRSVEILETYEKNCELLDQQNFARVQTDIGYAAMLCWEAVEMLVVESGGSVILDSNRLSQIFRDIRGGANHAFTTASTCMELYGRVLLGLEPQHIVTLSSTHVIRDTHKKELV
ncbi:MULTISPECIES: acyl-CoA dehydrogenase family protein [Paenibacillus]|jgi:alkylation response protein AidB-like acyl-CoA dehydrogenase|uniref:Acyl-CoA dehydrogenase family protein n=1 Tax=Paenibacillus polymyxa TaxID=1406 RepID=A0AAP3ZYR8_PAEPO|nr:MULTISPECIES: acyl-CoA dehydrogenase family protein [Paenibacillus]AIW40048.1 acyl-CoA dehydrogenase [Paenibacillus polymyxa CR1]ALA42360.1 acyl-CoA dehydrogenase [Paenibacillus peoriae]APB75915.1 acyl-CoA dehydrogenase [Paenibacillus polymyxa]MCP3747762.1 acyl-CoA dehydrogenase family protein [Paenibacillus sp. A3M_27_13]MDH2331531.1 acyl-CoA dehydrogenase family protein [Paenibacillus polymyxa]